GNGADLITLDFSRQLALAADPAQLVDSLDLLLMSNGMSPAMRAILVATLSDPSLADPGDRVRAAVRLIVTSPEYLVEREEKERCPGPCWPAVSSSAARSAPPWGRRRSSAP